MKKLLLAGWMVLAGATSFAAEQGGAELPAEAREILAETSNEPAVAAAGSKKEEASTEAAVAAPVQAVVPQQESEIPLNLEAKKAAAAGDGSLFRVIGGFAVLLLMAGGAYYLIRRHSKPGQRQNAPQIKILTQHWLGPKKSLAIVRVSGESILIGVTDHNISMLKNLSLLDDEIPVETPEKFEKVLADEETENLRAQTQMEEGEDFMMSGLSQVKESVSRRLKGMRSFQ